LKTTHNRSAGESGDDTEIGGKNPRPERNCRFNFLPPLLADYALPVSR
jgi:hypothetical protein